MKKLLLSILLTTYIVQSQNVNIPDINFKSKLLLNAAINTNGDDEIQVSEANNYHGTLMINGDSTNIGNIVDLTGIETFVNINGINCSYNHITTLDLTNNTIIQFLYAWSNDLVYLNGGNSEFLTEISCQSNALTYLNVTNCIGLRELNCYENQLNSIDVHNNTLLENFVCGKNQLTNLNVDNNIALKLLDYSYNNVSNLNTSNNTLLESLSCSNNSVANLNLTNNVQLKKIYCLNNNLTNLDLSTNINLTDLYVDSNELTSIDTSNLLALKTLRCINNFNLVALDLSQNINLYDLRCSDTKITSLDLSNNNNLYIVNLRFCRILRKLNLKNGNNNGISLIYSDFQDLQALQTVCIDDVNSGLANFIQQQVVHTIVLTENCTLSNNTQTLKRFALLPNPVENTLHIFSNERTKSVEVFNNLGQLVSTNFFNNEIDFTQLPKGLYLIKIIDVNEKYEIENILKN